MTLSISTPALLFPAITLLLLAYTNKFVALATIIRNLRQQHLNNPGRSVLIGQIENLRRRLNMIRYMQILGIVSFFLTVLCMFLLFQENNVLANYIFGASLLALLGSLSISLWETQISTKALNLELSDMEDN
ncbi:DUF2721 domain-containing protein [Fulvivirgaceae bacterium BMA10]|uniref:DUF2721 domain-containing protein n=1 Tax=Splendidivirga corallicola TaxID=3051826 RepID=A0ABT8KJH5_9BACT|nr:DUF2721 domain-containing protein [Fulvivirgaceae bacterium BMA10]